MKCPFRRIIKKENTEKGGTIKTKVIHEFSECYYEDCPYYRPEEKNGLGLRVEEGCMKAENEKNIKCD